MDLVAEHDIYESTLGTMNRTALQVDPMIIDYDDWLTIDGVEIEIVILLIVTILSMALQIVAFVRRRRRRVGIHPDAQADMVDLRNDPHLQESIARRMQEAQLNNNHECPICLAPSASFPVITDCGHVFCCACVIMYWQHSGDLFTPVKCAVCRFKVTVLLPIHWPSEQDVDDSEDSDTLADQLHENDIRVNDYNRRFSADRSVMDYIRDVPVMIPYFFRNFFATRNFIARIYQVRIVLILVFLLCYVMFPTDVLPDNIYGFYVLGFIDDLILGSAVFIYIAALLRRYFADRALARL
ncbi:unnamed protein product [Caenorhabditis auriculariae]|uniref:RING-type domain-containing protein n=1 Tax=Caenorhabditis auriculariae TaxID=2777116 RepID=A0A8S1H8W7_9PELO|nr:unnamed protein product [Caenorhabditis auriculariae]